MDKERRAATFRQRLMDAMTEGGLSKSALARAIGVDRSTLTQLLADGETRLPNAQLIAEAAAALRVSADWLLNLTDRPERPGDLIAAAVRESAAQRSTADDQLLAWHLEARGHKIRHVPATLPDMLKTERVLHWEYAAFLARTPDQAVGAMLDRFELLQSGGSDYEIAVPRHEIESLAAGTGYYAGLPSDVRREQLEKLETVAADMYPALRLFFFDAKKVFSAPVTVFGPIMAVLYVGRFYLAFRSEERVKSLAQHFDWLVRECDVDARDAASFMAGLGREVDAG